MIMMMIFNDHKHDDDHKHNDDHKHDDDHGGHEFVLSNGKIVVAE